MSEIKFLCCYCGIFIKKNRANLNRHEKLHEEFIEKIKCAMEKCEETFQNKSNYWAHWRLKHPNKTMPNTLDFVKKKSTLKKNIVEKKSAPSNAISSIGFEITSVILECLMREPLFGELCQI